MILLTIKNSNIIFSKCRDIVSIPYSKIITPSYNHIDKTQLDDLIYDINGSIGTVVENNKDSCLVLVISVNADKI